MATIALDLFTGATDPEAAQYRVLAGLQEARRLFARTRVYPHFAELIALRRALAGFLDGADRVRQASPGRVTGVDWEAGHVLYERSAFAAAPLVAEALARWALPLLDGAIEEGRTVVEFVEAHAAVAPVGLVPTYRQEGYLLVPTAGPDGEPSGELTALRYAVSVLAGEDGRYRTLRTHAVAAHLAPLAPPAVWKAALTRAYPDLPAPATFCVESDVAFPVEETVLPVAKRKLLRLVAERGEA